MILTEHDRPGPPAARSPWDPSQTAHLQNIAYRPSLVPLLVDSEAISQTVPVVEAYVAALDATLRRYVHDAAARDWFHLGSGAEELVCAEGEARARVRVCRLDGYVSGGRLRILENNADAPAGTLFTPRLNEFVATRTGYPVRGRLPIETGAQPFLDLLAGSGRHPGQRVVRVLRAPWCRQSRVKRGRSGTASPRAGRGGGGPTGPGGRPGALPA